MGTQIQQAKTLEERVREKLHEQIGDLITPDDIKAIVERGIEEALFKERVVKSDSYYHTKAVNPPLVHEIVQEELGKQMRAAVDAWLAEHPEEVQAAITKVVQDGIGGALLTALDNRFGHVFASGIEMLQSQGLIPRQQY